MLFVSVVVDSNLLSLYLSHADGCPVIDNQKDSETVYYCNACAYENLSPDSFSSQ